MSTVSKRIPDNLSMRIQFLKASMINDPDAASTMRKFHVNNPQQYYSELMRLSEDLKILETVRFISKISPLYMGILTRCSIDDVMVKRSIAIGSRLSDYFSSLILNLEDIVTVRDIFKDYSDLSTMSQSKFSGLYHATKDHLNNFITKNSRVPNKIKPAYKDLVTLNGVLQSLSRESETRLITLAYPGNIMSKISLPMKA
jgi:hypothetical protein